MKTIADKILETIKNTFKEGYEMDYDMECYVVFDKTGEHFQIIPTKRILNNIKKYKKNPNQLVEFDAETFKNHYYDIAYMAKVTYKDQVRYIETFKY